MPEPAAVALPPAASIAAAVAALPALPATDPTDRYGVRRLTVTWLAGFAPHTRTAYFRDLAHFLAWCQRDGLDPARARPADLDLYRAAVEQPAPGRPVPSPATVHRRLSALSSWYRHLLTNRAAGLSGNPAAGLRRPRVDRDASRTAGLTAAEVRALLAAADATAGIIGVAVSEATGTTGAKCGYYPATSDMVFEATLEDQTNENHALVQANLYADYAIQVDGNGIWYVDENDTTNVAVVVVGVLNDSDITLATVRARVLVVFLIDTTIYDT